MQLGDDPRQYRADVRGVDPSTDLALVKIATDHPLPYLRLGDMRSVRVGDWVMVIGNPLRLGRTVTVGVISATGRSLGITDISFENFIQTDAAINFGNSGGPMVNTARRGRRYRYGDQLGRREHRLRGAGEHARRCAAGAGEGGTGPPRLPRRQYRQRRFPRPAGVRPRQGAGGAGVAGPARLAGRRGRPPALGHRRQRRPAAGDRHPQPDRLHRRPSLRVPWSRSTCCATAST